MQDPGYYRFPTVHRDVIVFTAEDDLWTASARGGVARRLTAGLAECVRPQLSPDGSKIAFTGREEGNAEVYVLPAAGGPARRLTFLGSTVCLVVGWQNDEILFCTDYGQPFVKSTTILAVPASGGEPRSLGLGSAMTASFGEQGRTAIGRNTLDIARWKRYRGGTSGKIWVDADGSGAFAPLAPLDEQGPIRGNLATPMWSGARLYFVSDHEGVGNIYSCLPDGTELSRHTHHESYYARNPSTDGQSIVYHAGGDLFRLDLAAGNSEKINVEMHSPQTQRNRRLVEAGRYLEHYAVHPRGHSVAVVTRGQAFTMPAWEQAVQPVTEAGTEHGAARYRLTEWLHDGSQLLTVSDAPGEEALQVHDTLSGRLVRRLDLPIGRVVAMIASPVGNLVAIANHRQEVLVVDLDRDQVKVLDRSAAEAAEPSMGLSWSPDGRYVAYGFPLTIATSIIKVADVQTGVTHAVTRQVLRDHAPVFDPGGRYLYFLSRRVFQPVYDNLDFDMNFPKGMRPYCITLRRDLPSPFVAVPRSAAEQRQERGHEGVVSDESVPRAKSVVIDFEGIEDRVVAFPVPEDRYDQLAANRRRVFWTTLPVAPTLGTPPETPATATLWVYDLKTLELSKVAEAVTSFKLSPAGDVLAYRSEARLRLLAADQTDEEGRRPRKRSEQAFSRESGWLDLSRIKLVVEPVAEWRQMFREAWRLQRDHFWTEDMSGVDWTRIYARYAPLLDRVASRSEFSDLTWEMQGELGTSHCYEMGGDYRPEPSWAQGTLAAGYAWDEARSAWRITEIARGDSWEDGRDSPLRALGVNAAVGEYLIAVNGGRPTQDTTPRALLANQGGQRVSLTLGDAAGAERTVVVTTLKAETPIRYRAWVESNRQAVHSATDSRVGYVHVPNMMGLGMSEFFRGFLAEVTREALIVDVRYNGGGHTSQLILEKLARRRIGYGTSRWGQPVPYFWNAVLGPIVALTNEFAGSDGDIFSHSFKLLGLGTLVGKRTWGGVVGIWPRHRLADGGVTTQPEFSHWFEDTGWGVENYGTDPDVDVDIAPQDWKAGRDPQLATAIQTVLAQMLERPVGVPDFSTRPSLALPTLPPRKRSES